MWKQISNNILIKTIMNKKPLLIGVAAIVLCASACNKPNNDDPTPPPGPTPTEINSNNAAPGGFIDNGSESWD